MQGVAEGDFIARALKERMLVSAFFDRADDFLHRTIRLTFLGTLQPAMMKHAMEQSLGEVAQRPDGKGAGTAGEVADLERENDFGSFRNERAIGSEVISERLQRAADGRQRETGPRVESARTLASAAPADKIPFTWQHEPTDETAGGGVEIALEFQRGGTAFGARFFYEASLGGGFLRPSVCALK